MSVFGRDKAMQAIPFLDGIIPDCAGHSVSEMNEALSTVFLCHIVDVGASLV